MRVLIADDEPLARRQLGRLCEHHADLEVVAEVGTGADAIGAIRAHSPDVVLLDVELQDMTGFDVLESVSDVGEPLAIMVTAYPQHALKAFDAAAVDYLTKPVDPRRFGLAIGRARFRSSKAAVSRMCDEIAAGVRATLANTTTGGALPRHLTGERGHRLYFVCIEEIDFVEANGNYVTIHAGEDHYISRNTLKHLGEVLAPLDFLRIERSILLNLAKVAFVERQGQGVFAFTLQGGARLQSSATYRKGILGAMRTGRFEAR
jgi:two-component system, LytTR family, response regulator